MKPQLNILMLKILVERFWGHPEGIRHAQPILPNCYES